MPPLFLETLPPPTSPVAIAACVLSAVGLLVSILSIIRKESREDGQTVTQRLKKLESTSANHDNLHTGQVQARERLAESLSAQVSEQGRVLLDKVAHLSETCDRRILALEHSASEVQRLKETIAAMQTKLERLPGMEAKIDRLTELLTAALGKP